MPSQCLRQCAPRPYQVLTEPLSCPQKSDQYGQQLLQQTQCTQHDTTDPSPYRPLTPICDNFQHSKEHIPRLPKSVHGYNSQTQTIISSSMQTTHAWYQTVHPYAAQCTDKW